MPNVSTSYGKWRCCSRPTTCWLTQSAIVRASQTTKGLLYLLAEITAPLPTYGSIDLPSDWGGQLFLQELYNCRNRLACLILGDAGSLADLTH
jgi:hypothetical protein